MRAAPSAVLATAAPAGPAARFLRDREGVYDDVLTPADRLERLQGAVQD